MTADAAKVRKAMLANLRRVVRDCTCDWPVTKYRNSHGHHPDCPAVDAARLGLRIVRESTNDRISLRTAPPFLPGDARQVGKPVTADRRR